MLWTGWSFVSGLPLGALAALAWRPEPSPRVVVLAAVSCATLLAIATALRGRRVAGAAALGWAALPALGAALLALAPDPRLALVALAILVGLALGWETRGTPVRRGVAALVVSTAGILVWNATHAAVGAGATPVPESRAAALFTLDARVATRPLPRCAAQPRGVTTLLDRGAHPRFGAEGRRLWFDAEGADGRRQIHRLDLEDGTPLCWTCDEPGHNVRPSPGPRDLLVAFETDRHATWRRPTDSEIHVVAGDAAQPGRPSHRMTFDPGADGFPVFGPDAPLLAWSHASGGAHRVRAGSIRSGHGALRLGAVSTLLSAGPSWAAPLAWSPDARSLVVARGNPLAAVELLRLDPATGAVETLTRTGGLGAAFTGDGGWLVRAGAAEPHAATAWLPAGLGFLLGPWATAPSRRGPAFGRSSVRMGEVGAEADVELELEEIAGWGGVTGIALDPDGTRVVVGQRRLADGRVEERLLLLDLDCAGGDRAEGTA